MLAQAALEIKNPLTKSKIRILKVVNGMIESKKTKDTDSDGVEDGPEVNQHSSDPTLVGVLQDNTTTVFTDTSD